MPRWITTDAVTCALPSWNEPLPAGTLTRNERTDLMQVSGNDACPEPLGWDTLTTASTTVQRSGHEARTLTLIDRPSGASPPALWMSTVGDS